MVDLQALIFQIQNSRKYRGLGIPDDTIADILRQEVARYAKPSDALRSTKAILHNMIAPYLDVIDYNDAETRLHEALAVGDKESLQNFCQTILKQHDSTRERLPYLEDFYRQILSVCPEPNIILDLACGLNPFALPWMGMPKSVEYHAYDIHQPRVQLINFFMKGLEMAELAETRDILVRPPEIQADAAFLFKEAHRMEKRRKGASQALVSALRARVVFISLPNRSLDGQRDLQVRMDALVQQIVDGYPGKTGHTTFPGETLFWISREDG